MKQPNVHHKNCQLETTKKHSRFWTNVAQYFNDYSKNSTTPGIKYLAERNRPIFEKLFWLLFVITSICLCGYFINSAHRIWQDRPVITSFSNKLTPVWNIPFPAVTICPEKKLDTSVTQEELKRFEQLNFLCGDGNLINGSNIIGNDTIDFFFKVAPKSDEWLCVWENDVEFCNKLMTPTITDEGVCFTFNMLDREELYTNSRYYYGTVSKPGIKSTQWTLENGYARAAELKSYYPRRTIGGTRSLRIFLGNIEANLDYGCRGNVQGYKVLLHHPAEIPRLQHVAFIAPFYKYVVAAMKPSLITTDGLENYDPGQRQCYFSYERQLKYYQVYTQSNCELECLANYTLTLCGCVQFYMPRDPTTQFCERGKHLCAMSAKEFMVTREMELENADYENQNFNSHHKTEVPERCKCLLSCTSLDYEAETSAVNGNWNKYFEAKGTALNFSGYTLADVFFIFKTPYFTTIERKPLYRFTDFVSNCAGFLALFAGLSFLSIVEIIYFFTLRLICNIRMNGLHFWYESPEQ